jgi:hypothetical protein
MRPEISQVTPSDENFNGVRLLRPKFLIRAKLVPKLKYRRSQISGGVENTHRALVSGVFSRQG